MNRTVQYVPFVIDGDPYCAWGWDLRSRNLHFLSRFDPQYFEYLASTHVAALDGDHGQFGALALRHGFHQGLESFFALVGAALQAPDCVIGWFLHYRPAQLRRLVGRIASQADNSILSRLRLKPVSWSSLAKVVHRNAQFGDQARDKRTVELFATLWDRLAHEFLNTDATHEYNSIKHGLRAKPGGFSISVGLEPRYGVSPPPEEIHSLGGSTFGSSFYTAKRLGPKGDPNFRIIDHGLNCDPTALAQALVLISMSIGNVLSFLRIINGAPPREVRFSRPQEDGFFAAPWENVPTLSNCAFGEKIDEADIERKNAADIVEFYKDVAKPSESPH